MRMECQLHYESRSERECYYFIVFPVDRGYFGCEPVDGGCEIVRGKHGSETAGNHIACRGDYEDSVERSGSLCLR